MQGGERPGFVEGDGKLGGLGLTGGRIAPVPADPRSWSKGAPDHRGPPRSVDVPESFVRHALQCVASR